MSVAVELKLAEAKEQLSALEAEYLRSRELLTGDRWTGLNAAALERIEELVNSRWEVMGGEGAILGQIREVMYARSRPRRVIAEYESRKKSIERLIASL